MWHLLFTLKSWKLQFSGLLWLPSPPSPTSALPLVILKAVFGETTRRCRGGWREGECSWQMALFGWAYQFVSIAQGHCLPLARSAQKLCPCCTRPALSCPALSFALPLTKFALTSSSLPFHLASSSSSSSSSSLSRFFAAAQLSRVSVLINVDSGFLFAVAVAYTRVYLVGGIKGIKGANNQQPPPPPNSPLCRVIAGRVASRLLRLRIYWQYNFWLCWKFNFLFGCSSTFTFTLINIPQKNNYKKNNNKKKKNNNERQE